MKTATIRDLGTEVEIITKHSNGQCLVRTLLTGDRCWIDKRHLVSTGPVPAKPTRYVDPAERMRRRSEV